MKTEPNMPTLIQQIERLKDLLGKANTLARIRAERIKELEAQAGAEPVAWRYVDARGHFRYVGYKPSRDMAAEYPLLKPIRLYLHPSPPDGMVGGWMPMADAPRDGTLILAAIYIHSSDGTAEWQRHAIYFDEERDCTYLDGGDDTGWEFDDYEFWTPLPPPPTTPAGNEKGE